MVLLLCTSAMAAQYDSATIKVSLLNHDPDPARAGDTVKLRFKIENLGAEAADNFQIEVLQNYPFSVVDSPVKDLGTISEFQTGSNYLSAEFTVKVDKDTDDGNHDLKIRYRFGNQAWITTSFTIDTTSREFAQIVYVNKAKIQPGQETELTFTVTNVGNTPLQNMVFSWSEPNGAILPVYSDDTKYIKYLDVGKSTDLKYTVIADVNAKQGLYQLDLSLSYESNTNKTSNAIKTKAGVFIGGETDFEVAFSESTAGQTSLSVANTGNNPALSVSVKIPDQPGYRVTGTNSAIIGNLDKGDYTIVSFQIASGMANFSRQTPGQTQQRSALRNQSTNNNLQVVIDYTDTTGERRSVEKSVPIQFRGATTGTAQTFQRTTQKSIWQNPVLYIVLAIVIISFVLYRKKSLRQKILGAFKR